MGANWGPTADEQRESCVRHIAFVQMQQEHVHLLFGECCGSVVVAAPVACLHESCSELQFEADGSSIT